MLQRNHSSLLQFPHSMFQGLISSSINLSIVLLDNMYVSFSASTDDLLQTAHYVLGWTFKVKGLADQLDLQSLSIASNVPNTSKNTTPSSGPKFMVPVTFSYVISVSYLQV